MSHILSTIGIEMPLDFPVVPYEAIHEVVCQVYSADNTPTWHEYAGGWNGIAHRFRSCADHDTAFTESVRRFFKHETHEERHVQEHELFGFVTNGLASLESFFYALYAIASMLEPDNFPMRTEDEKRPVNSEKVCRQFAKRFSKEMITSVSARILASGEFDRWAKVRNILVHRASPGRNLYAGGEQDGEAWWLDIRIDERTTASRRVWLAASLRELLEAAESFSAARLGRSIS